MKISQIAIIPDIKPIQKLATQLEYLYKKVQEYNELVVKTNDNIEKYLKLKKQTNLEDSKVSKDIKSV